MQYLSVNQHSRFIFASCAIPMLLLILIVVVVVGEVLKKAS